jgi:sugar/nucleoside kinase (ribokinase family)
VAIMAARFGLPMACLGEVGDDYFGQIVLSGLEREGVSTAQVAVQRGGPTPVAGVLVDPQGEPGYLGYPGRQTLQALPAAWRAALATAEGVFVDGWIEEARMGSIVLEALRTAQEGGAQTFFDPGPGNPRQDNGWQREAAALATVVLATEGEIERLTGERDPQRAARQLLQGATRLVVVKRGAEGCVLHTEEQALVVPGLPLDVVDATGAGDSLAGAVIYGCLNGLALAALGTLANVTGGAKVRKMGTGHQVPTLDEIRAVLEQFGQRVAGWH